MKFTAGVVTSTHITTLFVAVLPFLFMLGIHSPAHAEKSAAPPQPLQTATPEENYKAGVEAYQLNDWMNAMLKLRVSAQADHLPSMLLLAYILDRAEEDTEAVEWYRKSADAGSPEGAMNLGRMIAEGNGVEKNTQEGVQWLTKSAEGEHLPAMLTLANVYGLGMYDLPADHAKAIEWLTKAADKGFTPAIKELAKAHREGLFGLTIDPKKAAELEQTLTNAGKKE